MVNSLSVGSSGYVVDTFVAAMWCLLTTANYRDCVLKAVNLGSDTDMTAAVAGDLRESCMDLKVYQMSGCQR